MFSFTCRLLCAAFLVFIGSPNMVSSHALSLRGLNRQRKGNGNGNGKGNPLTSHILDTTLGKPAAGVKSTLFKLDHDHDEQWIFITEQFTNKDGRIGNLISTEDFTTGVYKLKFDTQAYFGKRSQDTFYPYVEITFQIKAPEQHYHVPILLNNFGFTTYRGS